MNAIAMLSKYTAFIVSGFIVSRLSSRKFKARMGHQSSPWVIVASMAWIVGAILASPLVAQPFPNKKYNQDDLFRQLDEILPTPNGYRTAAGEPGPAYWQQHVDYSIEVRLNDQDQTIQGNELITYHNESPHTLRYLWFQLDANIFRPDSDANLSRGTGLSQRMPLEALEAVIARETFDGGFKIESVKDANGNPLKHIIVKTMMRVDLSEPLAPGTETHLSIAWNYKINDTRLMSGRTGFEYFPKDGNYIYEIAQWFPRLAAYTDATGWQHKQYLGQGEFTLELGDYVVKITVPDDHVVAATGVLQNPEAVLSEDQRKRWEESKVATKPVFIVTPEEAKANELEKSTGTKTWVFHAQKVRDFAFATSRKFIWDAQQHNVEGNQVMAMSYYPKEGEPLWSKYSTASIIHTLNVYSRYTFGYPYPTAISVNGPVGGMEYPMICFNGPRPEEDGTYSSRTKYALISVIIHEVGHNYFPMIVNSDERQWTWMDEGINTFLQYLSEQEWEENYPSRRGEPAEIVPYMLSSDQVPIMTNSESVMQFGNNAYAKPATALNILRETVLGRELFDYAFKEYARRWKFKRPMPADFFRTMEDASGVDLDWFWRGWFYTTDHCDIAIDKVEWLTIDERTPDQKEADARKAKAETRPTLSEQRNKPLPKLVDQIPDLKDFYNSYDPLVTTPQQREAYQRFIDSLTDADKQMIAKKNNFYVLHFTNLGGLVMPVIAMLEFEDGTTQEVRLPAEVWRVDATKFSKLVMTEKKLKRVELDPYRETADVDRNNNYFPTQIEPTRFEVFKMGGRGGAMGGRRGGTGRGGPRGAAPPEAAAEDNPMRASRQREERRGESENTGEAGNSKKTSEGANSSEAKPAEKSEAKPEEKQEPAAESKEQPKEEKPQGTSPPASETPPAGDAPASPAPASPAPASPASGENPAPGSDVPAATPGSGGGL
jgi:hypothetical protein